MNTAGKQRIHSEEVAEPITMDDPHETTAHLPLNTAQRAIWVAHHFEPDSPAYNVGQYTELLGCLDPALFAVAARQVVVQTEVLRLRFYDSPDGPMQCVVPFANWELPLRDFSDKSEPLAEADAWVHAEIARPFDLTPNEVRPLFRWTLLRIRSDRWYWVQVYHHLISDGYSRALIAAAVAKRYTGIVEERQTEELRVRFPLDVLSATDAAYRGSPAWTEDRAYWRELMAGWPVPTSLSAIAPVPSRRFRRTTRHLDPALVSRLTFRARELGATLPQLVAAAAGIYIHRLTGMEDIVVGMQVTGRLDAAARQTPALLTNTLPLRLHLRPTTRLMTVVGQTVEQLRAGRRRQRYRHEDLRADLGLGPLDGDLFSMVVNYHRFDYEMLFADLTSKTHTLSSGPVDDLALIIYELGAAAGLRLDLSGNLERYDATAVAIHADRLCRLLATIANSSGETLLAHLPVVDAAERETVLETFNNTTIDFPANTLVDLFSTQVARTPNNVALIYADRPVSYIALDAAANRLARQLIAVGVGPETVVALALSSSTAFVISLLATLKAGGAYLPIDPDYPTARLAFMLADSGARVLVTTAGMARTAKIALAHNATAAGQFRSSRSRGS